MSTSRRWKEFTLHGRCTWWLMDGHFVRATISTMGVNGETKFLASVRTLEPEVYSCSCLEAARHWVLKMTPPENRPELFTEDAPV